MLTGVNVLIATGFMQNNPEYYENPQVFDPDRWLPENVSKRHPFCYLPFSSGPRNCIGSRYAMFQLKTMAVSILRAFEIMPTKNCKKFEDINVIMSFTIKLSKTCEVTFREREKTLCHHQ
ncbi:cytochrome P450 6B3-like [Diaphorina citri]|jgi:Cytochrome P450|uniref:Cytochrome P450 6B3-like n=1 Tax=Diaphorina citri TaxID=121845 RepID=A0A1S3DRD0_DIACI|nr:cytochrome P450 6B3-like [Diaphorina citri]